MWFLTQPPGAFHLSLGLPLSLLLWDAGNDSSKAAWGEYSFQHRTLFPCILEPKEGKQWLQKLPLRDVRERSGAHRGGCGGTRSWWSGLPWGKALQRIGAPAALHDQLPNPVCLSATCFTTCSFGPPAATLPICQCFCSAFQNVPVRLLWHPTCCCLPRVRCRFGFLLGKHPRRQLFLEQRHLLSCAVPCWVKLTAAEAPSPSTLSLPSHGTASVCQAASPDMLLEHPEAGQGPCHHFVGALSQRLPQELSGGPTEGWIMVSISSNRLPNPALRSCQADLQHRTRSSTPPG